MKLEFHPVELEQPQIVGGVEMVISLGLQIQQLRNW
jgi:hypothetical protein